MHEHVTDQVGHEADRRAALRSEILSLGMFRGLNAEHRVDEELQRQGVETKYKRRVSLAESTIANCMLEQPEAIVDATGCADPRTGADLVERIGHAMPGRYPTDSLQKQATPQKTIKDVYNSAVLLGAEVRTGDGAEGIIAQNVVLAQTWATTLLTACGEIRGGIDPGQERLLRLATRFMDVAARQAEVLRRLRHGGTQVVRVERVDIHSGGQAVIGAVAGGPAGGGRS